MSPIEWIAVGFALGFLLSLSWNCSFYRAGQKSRDRDWLETVGDTDKLLNIDGKQYAAVELTEDWDKVEPPLDKSYDEFPMPPRQMPWHRENFED